MKTLKIINYFVLVITVFLIVFVSPFINFAATNAKEILVISNVQAKFFMAQIILGSIFGVIGLLLALVKNRIARNILFFVEVIVALATAVFLGRFFNIWSIFVVNGILPMIFIVLYLVLEFIPIAKDFQKHRVHEPQQTAVEETFENNSNYDLKTQISNLKTNLSKPSFQILEEIDSTGSFAGINMESILNKEENPQPVKKPVSEVKPKPVKKIIVEVKPPVVENMETEVLPDTQPVVESQTVVEESAPAVEEPTVEVIGEPEVTQVLDRPEYDYNDLTELSFEQNKNREDFEIIKPRRSEHDDKKVVPLEVEDE